MLQSESMPVPKGTNSAGRGCIEQPIRMTPVKVIPYRRLKLLLQSRHATQVILCL